MQSFIMNSHEVFIHIHQGCFAGTGAIIRLPQCQWSKPDGYGKISQCITTTKHSKAKTVCIFLGIYCKTPLRREQHWLRQWCYQATSHQQNQGPCCHTAPTGHNKLIHVHIVLGIADINNDIISHTHIKWQGTLTTKGAGSPTKHMGPKSISHLYSYAYNYKRHIVIYDYLMSYSIHFLCSRWIISPYEINKIVPHNINI